MWRKQSGVVGLLGLLRMRVISIVALREWLNVAVAGIWRCELAILDLTRCLNTCMLARSGYFMS